MNDLLQRYEFDMLTRSVASLETRTLPLAILGPKPHKETARPTMIRKFIHRVRLRISEQRCH